MDEEPQQCPISAFVLPDGADAREAQAHVERIRVNELLRYVESLQKYLYVLGNSPLTKGP